MKNELTPKQEQVLDAIRRFQEENGFPPTVRELADLLGQSSSAGIHKLLMILRQKGFLHTRDSGKSRTIKLTGNVGENRQSDRMKNCPIVGNVAAGQPQLAVEDKEGEMYLDSEWVGQEDVFLLRVRGHSMIDADIRDNDLLIVQITQACHNGDIIIAMLEEEATVKRFYKEKDRIRLQPENQTMHPIYIPKDDPSFRIVGKVKGLLRKY